MRVGGIITISKDGTRLAAKGSWTWNLGRNMREAVTGHDETHGYKELPQTPFCEGAITVQPGLDVPAILDTVDATITLQLASGHVFVLRDAWYANEGSGTTEEGELPVKFEGRSADLSNP